MEPQYVQINSVFVRDVTLPPSIKEAAIQRKLTQEQEALEYEFRLKKAKRRQKVRIEAGSKALANRILNASSNHKYSS